MKQNKQNRSQLGDVWKAGADFQSRLRLLGLYCHRYHKVPGRHLLKRLLLPNAPSVQVKLALEQTLEVCLRQNDPGDRASFFENFFELPLALSFPREPLLIVDAGAHIGCFSLFVHNRWPKARLIAFEPEQKNLPLLRQNFSLNQINGEVVPKAVWKEEATLTFAGGQSNSGFLTAGTKQKQSAPTSAAREVEATSLSAYFRGDLKKIDLLKLDVEGAELAVLDQELPHCSPHTVILCELHFTEIHQPQFEAIISRHGWRADLYDSSHPPHSTWILRHCSTGLAE